MPFGYALSETVAKKLCICYSSQEQAMDGGGNWSCVYSLIGHTIVRQMQITYLSISMNTHHLLNCVRTWWDLKFAGLAYADIVQAFLHNICLVSIHITVMRTPSLCCKPNEGPHFIDSHWITLQLDYDNCALCCARSGQQCISPDYVLCRYVHGGGNGCVSMIEAFTKEESISNN